MLDVKLPFDEQALIVDYTPYLLRVLKLQGLEVHREPAALTTVAQRTGSAVDVSAVMPGSPIVVFSSDEQRT